MSLADLLQERLRTLPLKRLGPPREAGLWITSLPWPRMAPQDLSLGGRPTFIAPLGQWPGEPEGTPRRLLMVSDGANSAPSELKLESAAAPETAPPTAEAELFARCQEEGFMWERHLLRLRWGGRTLGLAMGLRFKEEVHWWECCRLVIVQETPTCRVIEMGGAIPRLLYGMEEMQKYHGYENPFLHRHNWLNGRLFARLHANGVCEIFAHHINSRFVDDGADLEDVVPVLGLRTEASEAELRALRGPWRGDQEEMILGGVRIDVSEVARLATPGQPGHLDTADGFLVWQPYEGVELYSGAWARQMLGDPFIYHSTQRIFPRGMARTLRFSVSLSDRSPRIVRYLPPAWWYGVCEEFQAAPLLPVSNAYDRTLESCREYIRTYTVKGGFEDGALPRGGNPHPGPRDRGRSEAGWEGEAPWAQFLLAWRTGEAEDYDAAMRSAWHYTDVAIDHAAKMTRMHGYGGHAFALPMNRVNGCIAAYLETGVPYLIEAAQAVVDNAHWTQKNSWPRLAVGRDAKYVRGAVMLYRYLADEHYRRMAYEGALMVAESQRPNGSFGDQAGGTGIHQWGAYITKPWMGLMATEGLLDYLELFPDEERLVQCVKRFADWLMQARYDHDGVMGWGYQHDFNGQPRHYNGRRGWVELPGKGLWHQNSLGRLLTWATLRFHDPAYFDAWAESYAASPGARGDHAVVTSAHPIPWVQSHLWQPELTPTGIRIRPVHLGPRTERQATILGPDGPVPVAWEDEQRVRAPEGVEVDLTRNLALRR